VGIYNALQTPTHITVRKSLLTTTSSAASLNRDFAERRQESPKRISQSPILGFCLPYFLNAGCNEQMALA
jgi:hypothetical protein